MPPWEQYKSDGSVTREGPWSEYSTPQEKQGLDLLDVPGQALQNLGTSAKEFGRSVVQPVIHPVETVENIGKLGLGVGEKLGIPGTQGYGQYADAVGEFFKNRYGGWENFKKTMATDPVGFVSDALTVAMPMAGLPGKVGEVAGAAARLPITAAERAPSALGKLTSAVGGTVTGVGAENIQGAARAGYEGSKEFLQNLRDPGAYQEGIVQKTRQALSDIRMERSASYQRDIAPISNDPTILKFDDIDAAINKAHAIKQFQGKDVSSLVGANQKLPAEIVKDDLERAVATWRRHDPAVYHTPAGFDALKQYIGDVRDHYAHGTPERKIADEIYSAVRNTIVKQAPDYARVMKNYQEASDKIDEITKTLSLGRKASEDTALRKLLSSTRSNVNTNFGRRMDLVKELNKRDPSILPSLQGQALSGLAPGGIRGALAGAGGAMELGAAALHGGVNPSVISALIASSPRLWGELAYKAGQAGRKAKDLTPQQVTDLLKRVNPDIIQQVALGARAGGSPGRLRINVGTGETTNAPQ